MTTQYVRSTCPFFHRPIGLQEADNTSVLCIECFKSQRAALKQPLLIGRQLKHQPAPPRRTTRTWPKCSANRHRSQHFGRCGSSRCFSREGTLTRIYVIHRALRFDCKMIPFKGHLEDHSGGSHSTGSSPVNWYLSTCPGGDRTYAFMDIEIWRTAKSMPRRPGYARHHEAVHSLQAFILITCREPSLWKSHLGQLISYPCSRSSEASPAKYKLFLFFLAPIGSLAQAAPSYWKHQDQL